VSDLIYTASYFGLGIFIVGHSGPLVPVNALVGTITPGNKFPTSWPLAGQGIVPLCHHSPLMLAKMLTHLRVIPRGLAAMRPETDITQV